VVGSNQQENMEILSLDCYLVPWLLCSVAVFVLIVYIVLTFKLCIRFSFSFVVFIY
jgi:hypothetical protein